MSIGEWNKKERKYENINSGDGGTNKHVVAANAIYCCCHNYKRILTHIHKTEVSPLKTKWHRIQSSKPAQYSSYIRLDGCLIFTLHSQMLLHIKFKCSFQFLFKLPTKSAFFPWLFSIFVMVFPIFVFVYCILDDVLYRHYCDALYVFLFLVYFPFVFVFFTITQYYPQHTDTHTHIQFLLGLVHLLWFFLFWHTLHYRFSRNQCPKLWCAHFILFSFFFVLERIRFNVVFVSAILL